MEKVWQISKININGINVMPMQWTQHKIDNQHDLKLSNDMKIDTESNNKII